MSVVPPRGVLGALDSRDPLFASECVGLGPGEEGELGEDFRFDRPLFYSKKQNFFNILNLFRKLS